MSSQTKREPMLLFEFDAALFQFEQREPEFAVSFQLPPRMTAYLPSIPLLLPALYPSSYHCAYFGQQYLRCLELIWR